MSDLFKCEAHLRLIDEEGELGSVSIVTAGVNGISYFGKPKKNKEYDIDVEFSKRKQGKVGISESVRPDVKSEYETRYQCTQ